MTRKVGGGQMEPEVLSAGIKFKHSGVEYILASATLFLVSYLILRIPDAPEWTVTRQTWGFRIPLVLGTVIAAVIIGVAGVIAIAVDSRSKKSEQDAVQKGSASAAEARPHGVRRIGRYLTSAGVIMAVTAAVAGIPTSFVHQSSGAAAVLVTISVVLGIAGVLLVIAGSVVLLVGARRVPGQAERLTAHPLPGPGLKAPAGEPGPTVSQPHAPMPPPRAARTTQSPFKRPGRPVPPPLTPPQKNFQEGVD